MITPHCYITSVILSLCWFAAHIGSANFGRKSKMNISFAYFFTMAIMLSAIIAEDCGYVRRPLAATNDTVVINLDCNQATPDSHDISLHLRDNVTHVAVQLLNCHTVPVGLFTNVTDNLTSVTVASEDAVQFLEGTFEGLGHVTELRLLGFSSLLNLSRSLFAPLRNIETLILDRFCRSNIELSYIGSVIQQLSGTPLKKLVLNDILDTTHSRFLEDKTIQANDFKITNASVKELIISNTPIHYEGSIRRAFPHLFRFCGSTSEAETGKSLPVMWDLILLSNTLEELVFYRLRDVSGRPNTLLNVTIEEILKVFFYPAVEHNYPELRLYFIKRLRAINCAGGLKLSVGANISRMTINRMGVFVQLVSKPICFEENNKLEYLDLSGSPFPSNFAGFRGLTKLKYLSLENTRINTLPKNFLQYFPALEILKLSKLDIRNFIESLDDHFFMLCPTLTEIHLDNCQLKQMPATLFSRSLNLERLQLSNNFLQNLDFDISNCTKLNILNFSSNNVERFPAETTNQLNELALRKPEGNNLLVDLSSNTLHCLCNSTHFVKWLQHLPSESNIKFLDFDNYICLYPNGSFVRVSETSISELEDQCSVLKNLANGSDCPCDEEERKRLSRVQMSLDGFFCRSDSGDLVAMKNQPLPGCFNPFSRASFIAPVVVGGILAITVLITVGLLIYYRNSRRVKQVRECLEMNPMHFVRTAIQYVMLHNRGEEHTVFRYDIIIFVQDDDCSSIHGHFIAALQRSRSFITRDDFRPGVAVIDAMVESIQVCQWIVPVITMNFMSDPLCVDFISRVQFCRPHALIPIVWEQPLAVTDVSVAELLQSGDPLYWPGDVADDEDKRRFWSSLLEKTSLL